MNARLEASGRQRTAADGEPIAFDTLAAMSDAVKPRLGRAVESVVQPARAWRTRTRPAREAIRRLGFRARYSTPLQRRPKFELAICAIFRDEADYLAEWVTFHRLQGVEHFWLYDNLSEDDWRSALAPERQSGVVTVTPWSQEPGQLPAYRDCLRRHRMDARWIAFIDIDEFLFSPSGRSIPNALLEFDDCAGVAVNWRMYGTNGYVEPPQGLVVENYVMRGRDAHRDNRFVKSIMRPRRTLEAQTHGLHIFDCLGGVVGEDRQLVSGSSREPATAETLRINHYYARSEADLARKRSRPEAAQGRVRSTAEVPRDEVRDETILQFLPALKQAMAARAGS